MRIRLLIAVLFLFTATGYAQTISGPSLHCATTQANGNVVLNWTNNTCPCGGLPTDSIFVSSTGINGPYTFDTVLPSGTTQYTETVTDGNTVTYFYYMASSCGCPGFTELHSDTINNRNPQTPGINFVTVNANGTSTLNWQRGSSSQTFGYVIYEVVNGTYIPIDTVYGINDTTFTDLKSKADSGSVSYSVAAIDSCGNIGPYNTIPQNTIYLTYSVNNCAQSVTLNWDAYNNWPGVQSYSAFITINGGPSVLIGTYQNDTSKTTYSGLHNGDNICVWVVANEKGGGSYQSSSNTQCTSIKTIVPVSYCYIKRITTVNDHRVDVTFIINPNASLKGIILERSDDNSSFYIIAYVPLPSPLSPIIDSDKTLNAATTSFYYRIAAVDSCNDTTFSSSASNIVLKGYAFSTLSNYLVWNPFYFQYGTLINYNLYRMYNNMPYSLDATTDSASYKEDVSALVQKSSNGLFCYYVIATDSIHYPNGVIDTTTSMSNIVCLNQGVEIIVPNAIVPEGKNRIFKPQFINNNITTYNMQIYNRWGGLIFETSDFTQGWDGTYKGKVVEQGVYAYSINLVDSDKQTVQKTGTVMVIR